MNELILFIGLLLNSSMTITSYRSIASQTDGSPNYTSIGERTHKGGCAVSRDLLSRWGGKLNYGDYILVEGFGIYKVNDCMGETEYDRVAHKRFKIKQHIDIWVSSYDEEKRIGRRHRAVYLLTRHLKDSYE